MFVAGIASGRLAARHGSKRVLILGAGLSACSLLGLTLLHDQIWQVLLWTGVMGLAFGLAFAAMSNLVVESVPSSQTGVASGMNANIRTVGGALGGAILASVVTAGARSGQLPVERGYTHGFLILALCSFAATAVAAIIPTWAGPEPADFPGEVRHAELAIVAAGALVSDTARP
jgi:MFS family permease